MTHPFVILYADDDPDDRELFAQAVKEVDKDIQCNVVNDGYEALNYLNDPAKDIPDYVFLDLRMPKMSGKKCLEKIRETDRLKNIPVVIYSVSDTEESVEELSQSGATRFVTKPSSSEEIYYLLSMILSEKWV